jgi:hypothetical protein
VGVWDRKHNYGFTSSDTSECKMYDDVFKRPNARLMGSHRMSGCHKLAYLRRRLAGWPQPKVFVCSLKVCCVCEITNVDG